MAANPRNWLTDDKTPFLLAILLGGLAWCVDHVASRAAELPIIEYAHYDVSKLVNTAVGPPLCPKSAGMHSYAYLVRNISARHAFKDLSLYFYSETNSPITEARWIDRPPGLAEQASRTCNPDENSRAITLQLKQLQWGWNGITLVWTKSPQAPLLLYRAPEGVALSVNSAASDTPPVLLVESNFTTWVIRNEFNIYYALIAFFVSLIVLFFVGVYVRHP
jgi:hypothetical protein